ncbi:MAG: ATP-binding protein [Candidatus Eisenbacteria bacterium]
MISALAAGLPAVLVATWALALPRFDTLERWTLGVAVYGAWLMGALLVGERLVRPLHTLSNMIAALREGDFSIRARRADPHGAIGLALWEVNALAESLRQRRLDVTEATALLRHVMDSIDVALFAFDEEAKLRLLNREAERLVALPAERALGRSAADLGLAAALEGDTPRLIELPLAGGAGRWELRRGPFRQAGRPNELLVLSDLTRSLREEERVAWQRLVRVLSHEINNSLTPIQSLAGTLRDLLDRDAAARASPDREGPPRDLRQGLEVIENRSRSLSRFMNAYAQLARLPRPRLAGVDVPAWVGRVVALESRLPVSVETGPGVMVSADGDQLDQLLINLLRNAVDAALETGGSVTAGWTSDGDWLELRVRDSGPGLADTANLFVPFFTTKENGSGIGLALCRQIAEAHGGTLSLANREGARGAIAILRLPVRRG